jgi:hypothetical protein
MERRRGTTEMPQMPLQITIGDPTSFTARRFSARCVC